MRIIIALILSFVYLAAGTPNFYWSYSGNPGGLFKCVQILETASNYWNDNFLCSLTHDVSSWVWSSAGQPAGSSDMNCVQWYEPADPSWSDNWLCIPKTDNEFFYKWSYNGNPNDGSTCVQITEPGDNNGWDNNYFCAYDQMANTVGYNYFIPFTANTAQSYRIPNPIWWISSSDQLSSCAISGTSDMWCELAGSPKARDVIIHSNGNGPTAGSLTMTISNGLHETYGIYQRAGSLACIHGEVHINTDGTTICSCVPGWFGPDCTSLHKVTATLNQPFRPASYIDGSAPITQCYTYGFAAWNPQCQVSTDFLFFNQIDSTQIQLSGGYSGSTGMLAFLVAGQYWIYASLTLGDGFYKRACVNGFYVNNQCVCKTGFRGDYCDLPACDADCGNGACIQTDMNTVQCSCYEYYNSDPNTPLSQCNIFDCASTPCDQHGTCVGSGSSTSCQCDSGWGSSPGGYCNLKLCQNHGLASNGVWSCNHADPANVVCDFTRAPYPGTYPGWCKSAALSQECSPGPGDIPVSFVGFEGMYCGVPETDVYEIVDGIAIALHVAAFFLEIFLI